MATKPLANRMLIKPVTAKKKTQGSIIIPDSAKEKPLKGEVLAMGKGTKDEETVLKIGNKVLYSKCAGTEVKIKGEKLMIMKQSDMLAMP